MKFDRRHGIMVVEALAKCQSDMNILKPIVARSYEMTSYQIIKRPQVYHRHVLVARADMGKFHYLTMCNTIISLGVLSKVLSVFMQNNSDAGESSQT